MPEEKKFTVKEFRNYLESSDSFGDALYYCDETHIDEANLPKEEEDEDY